MTLAELREVIVRLPDGASLLLPKAALAEVAGDGLADGTSAPAPAGFQSGRDTTAPTAHTHDPAPPMLTAKQVADRLATSLRWVYDHQRDLGGKRLSRRCLRFPESAVRRHINRTR